MNCILCTSMSILKPLNNWQGVFTPPSGHLWMMSSSAVIGGDQVTWPRSSPLIGPAEERRVGLVTSDYRPLCQLGWDNNTARHINNHRSRHSDDTLYPALSHSQYTVFDLIRETPQRWHGDLQCPDHGNLRAWVKMIINTLTGCLVISSSVIDLIPDDIDACPAFDGFS